MTSVRRSAVSPMMSKAISNAEEAGGERLAVPGSITRPLDFRALTRRPPPVGFDAVPLLDVILVFVLLAIGSSRFLFAPGLDVDLGEIPVGAGGGVVPAAVLTVMPNEQFFLGGLKVPRAALGTTLADHAQALPESQRHLLLKIDQRTPLEETFAILAKARLAGFETVRIAGEERREQLELFRQHGSP